MRLFTSVVVTAGLLATASVNTSAAPAPAEALYQQHCAACHGAERLGGIGPALLPQNLSRLRSSAASEVITKGRALTQMPAFGQQLSATDITALTDYIYQPPAQDPVWGLDDINA